MISFISVLGTIFMACLFSSEGWHSAQGVMASQSAAVSAQTDSYDRQATSTISTRGVITVNGTELQKRVMSPSPATGVIVISGSESRICPPRPMSSVDSGMVHKRSNQETDSQNECKWSIGKITAQIGSFSATAKYGQGSTAASVTDDLAHALNVAGSPVTATTSGNLIEIVTKSTGSAENYPMTVTACASFSLCRLGSQVSDFHAVTSGPNLNGGTDGAPGNVIYDTGVIQISIYGYEAASVIWDRNSTAESVAHTIQSVIASNINLTGILTTNLSGTSIIVRGKELSKKIKGPIAINYIHSSFYFKSPSFTASSDGMKLSSDSSGAN